MKRLLTALSLAPLALSLAHSPARAETDWKTVMAGIDGIVVYCRSTTREKYAAKICGTIAAAVSEGFGKSPLSVTDAGMVYTGAAAGKDENSDPLKTRSAHSFANPLFMRVHIKGTDDNNPAIYVGLRTMIAFEAATNSGSDLPGKAGDLVIEEVEAVANGPKSKLPAFIAANIAKRTKALIGEIVAGM